MNTTGTGFTINNNTIDISDGTNGGQIQVAGNDNTNPVNGAIFNINGAASLVDTGNFFIGDAANAGGTVNQTDGTVNVAGHMRVGHWPTNTSNYNLRGGSLNFIGATPGATPSGTAEQATGGVYLGIDGTGNLTQSGSSIINTKFVVLDNRTLTAAGANMPTGIDTLTLSGGTLNLASAFGIISRNPTSTLVLLDGGNIVNTAAAGTAVVLDTPITVGATGGTLNTSANATSSFILTSNVTGVGNAITLTGAGKLTLQPNSKATLDGTSDGLGTQTISANLNSGTMQVEKIGTGTTTLAGTNNYTGPTTVTAGTLALTGSLGDTAVAINTGGTFAPSGNVGAGGSITLNAGGVLNVGGNSAGLLASTISSGALTLNGGTVNADFTGSAVDRVNTSAGNGLTISATTANILLGPSGWVTGTYPAFTYAGTVQGTGATALTVPTPVGHNTVAFIDNLSGTVNLVISATTNKWIGGAAGFVDVWNINDKLNWNVGDQKYLEGDNVLFDDTAVNFAPTLAANVSPASVNIANSASNYTLGGAAGIAGLTHLSMNGGTAATKFALAPVNAALAANASAHTYTGATSVNSGTLVLDYTGLTGANAATARVINNASAVSVAPGATLQAIRGDGPFIFGNNLTGTGTVELNAHAVAGGVLAHSLTLPGTNTGFTGTLRLLSPVTGTYRLSGATQANLGGASIDVQSGAQLFLTTGTYTNNITIAGTGFTDASANIGALRIDGTLYAGNIVVNGAARIGSHNSTGTISGSISGGNLEFHVSNYGNNYTTILTGTNTYGTTTIGGGNTQGTVVSMRLNIGNGGTSGTLGAGNVTINGDGANGVLGFDRADGYTLGAGQAITGGGSQITRTFIDIDTLGAGFSDNGNAITLGTQSAGGNFRVGQTRVGAIANISGALTAQNFYAGSATTSTTNFNSGANVNVGLLYVARTGATGSVVNINPGALVNVATLFNFGELSANNSGFGFQSGGGVTVGQQMRIGHWPTETSSYTISGGSLSITANPGLGTSPYSIGVAEQNGGIYLGIDGTGSLNQSNGTVTTDWVVLDNRGNTGAGTNMPDGIDRYNLSGGTLEIRGQYGITNGNVTTEFNFTGGFIKNVGVGVNAAISGVGNFVIGTGSTPTIDTNGATNAFTVTRSLSGPGVLTKISAGTLNLTVPSPLWTGGNDITGGIVNVNADSALGNSASPVSISNNAVLQASGTVTTAARTVTLGVGGGTIDTNGQRVNLNAGSTVTGTTLTKVGAGVLTLAGTQTYAALDVDSGDVNLDSPLGTGTSTANVDGRMNISVNQTLGNLTIGGGGIAILGGAAFAPEEPAGAPALADAGIGGGGDLSGAPVQGVPEPGSAMLLFGGMLTLLGLRRR